MALSGLLAHAGTLSADGVGLTAVTLIGRDEPDYAVVVLVVTSSRIHRASCRPLPDCGGDVGGSQAGFSGCGTGIPSRGCRC